MSGLLIRYGRAGHRITWIVVTDGAAGDGGRDADLARARSSEAKEAASLASATLVECGLPDGQLAWAAGADAIIGQHLASMKPNLIVTHSANDYHADHKQSRGLSVIQHQSALQCCAPTTCSVGGYVML